MAGSGSDIMEATGLRDIKIYESGYLADFYALMKSDPNFNEDDYYMNVFAGLAHQNKLFLFPGSFRYEVAGINSTVSAALTNSFTQCDTITYRQMLDIYRGLADNSGLYLSYYIDALTAINNNLMSFVDFDNKTCSFNSAYFIEFIKDLKSATNPQKVAAGELGRYRLEEYSRIEQKEYALQYLFMPADITLFLRDSTQILTEDSKLHPVFYPYAEKEVFTHFVPITDDSNRLAFLPAQSFCINAASPNKELAWEFIKFMSTPECYPGLGNKLLLFPVHKNFFKSHVSAKLTQYVDSRQNAAATDEETRQIVQRVMTLLEGYNEMPMKYQAFFSTGGGPAYDIMEETMVNFYNGVITAEQAASKLQDKISLYLME
jgi:hypothetical protein